MARVIKSSDSNLNSHLADLISANRPDFDSPVNESVKDIIKDICTRGDDALIEYTNKFDRTNFSSSADIQVTSVEIETAYTKCDREIIGHLELAAKRIKEYHQKQMPQKLDYKDKAGVRLGNIWKAVDAVGIYVPGGLATYPSSVLMNAIPARVAGVKDIIMVTPTPDNQVNDVVLAAAKIAGIDKIFKIGGAQAIAAMAYGTKTVPPVDKIVGPGNAYVAAAKRLLFGIVGIDMVAGPSEILIVSDDKTNPEWVAADLLSQAEHDVNARSILITDSEAFAIKVKNAVDVILSTLGRQEIARKSWQTNGVIFVVSDLKKESCAIINKIAPEHLELCVENPDEYLGDISNAGAIFLGRYTPEAIGDYIAGPSHVLPTAGTARFSSGLSVYDFIKRISLIGCSPDSFDKLSKPTYSLANAEGLGAHALSVTTRCDDK